MSDQTSVSDLNDYFHQQIPVRNDSKAQLEQEIAELITKRTGKPRVAHHNIQRSNRRHERLLMLFSPPMLLLWILILASVIWLI